MNSKVKMLLATLAAGMMLVAGCAAPKSSEPNATTKKDSVVLAVSSEPEGGFDPTKGWGHSASSIFHSVLVKRDKDMKIVNELATGYTLSEDKLKWTVGIRDDIKFSDGSKLTADDVVYSYSTAKNTPDSNVDLTMIKSVAKIDEKTVEFTIDKPQSTFVDKLMEIGIVPEAIHKADPAAYGQKPIGCGPYVLAQWDKGQQVIATRNENYHGTKPQFAQVTLLYLSEDAIMTAVKAGSVDMASIPVSLGKEKIEGFKTIEVKSVENQGICFPVVKPTKVMKEGKEITVGNAVTSDVAIRKAINIAVNRETMIEGLLEGYGTVALTGFEQMPWNNEDVKVKDGDIEGAKKILDDAGWKDTNADTVLEKDGVEAKFDIIYTPGSEQRQKLAVYLADYLKQIGIVATPVQKSWADADPLMHQQPTILSWGEHSPQLEYQLYHSKFRLKDFYNTGSYSNQAVDKYIDAALAAADDTEANDNWKKAAYDGATGFSVSGDATWAWFYNTNHLYIMRSGLDIGTPKPQPHGGAILDNIMDWKMQ